MNKISTFRQIISIVMLIVAVVLGQNVFAQTFTIEESYNSSTHKTTFTIRRSGSSLPQQTIKYRTVNLSAYAGQHYTAVSGDYTFPANETTKTVEVTESSAGTAAYQYQSSTTRSYRFEVLDINGFELQHYDRSMTTGAQFNAAKVSKEITDLVYFNGSTYASGLSSGKYLDVSFTPPSGYVEANDENGLVGYVLIDDSYNYATKPATVSTSTLINSTNATASYLNSLGYKIYATVCFSEKERDDGYQYVQILAGTSSASYDGYDPDGSVNDPDKSVYKACYELADGSNSSGKAFFPHRYDCETRTSPTGCNQSSSNTEFNLAAGRLWKQKYKSGYQADNSGSLVFNANVANITTRFDAAGGGDDTWGYKDLFVRMALCDATNPTLLNNSTTAITVSAGPYIIGNTFYISVPFNEIVHISGAYKQLITSWGNVEYVEGDNTNVITYKGTINATAGTTLAITGIRNSLFNDLAGNYFQGSDNSFNKTFSGVTCTENYILAVTNTSFAGLNGDYWVSDGTVLPQPHPTVYFYKGIVNTSNRVKLTETTNYTLAWTNNTSAGDGTVTATGAGNYSGSVSTTFPIRWTTYTVSFHSNGSIGIPSTGTMNDQTFTYNTAQNLTANAFSREGFSFAGWNTSPDGSGTSYTNGQSVNNLTPDDGGTIDLYAQWTVIPWTGSGSSGSPYLIIYPSQLDLLASNVNGGTDYSGKFFKLGADITYGTIGLGENESNYTAIGTTGNPFRGTFDGDGKTISGIRLSATGSYQGLFGNVASGTIKNVILANSIITGYLMVGGIVGESQSSSVTNCFVKSDVTIKAGRDNSASYGGIVGYLWSSAVSGCISAAEVTDNGYNSCHSYGGIVGLVSWNSGSTVKDCLYIGTTVTASKYLGAIVGKIDDNNNTLTLTNNYYTAIELGGVGGNGNATVSADCDGARRARTITLGEGITLVGDHTSYDVSGLTAIGTSVLSYNDGTAATIYSGATQNVTPNYTGIIPEGYRLAYYSVNNEPVEGNTFEMPAADAVVEAVLLERYYTYNSTTGELALIFGAFNSSNKWGSDVIPSVVTSVTATDEVSFTGSCSELFSGFSSCTSMDLSNVNTDALTHIACMFFSCGSLTTLDLSSWNTENVTDMSNIFAYCKKLTTLDLSNWNTENVTNMSSVFGICSNLTTLNLSGWNTSNVTDMGGMFTRCTVLTTIEGLSDFNTSNVTDMSEMFSWCTGLTTIEGLSNFDTGNVTNMRDMFGGCSNLTSLDLSGWNTASVTNMCSMFFNCTELTTIYASTGWSTSSVTTSDSMFSGCTSLVGGMSTTFDANHINGDYACYDKGQDQPGYLTGVFTLTLPEDVAITTAATFTHDGTNYYKGGHDVTIAYNGTPPTGYRFDHFTVNGDPVDGDTFAMPFKDAEIGVEYQGRYTFDSTTGVLSLNWGEFNGSSSNKWGSDVTPSEVTSVTATDEVSFTGSCFELFRGFSSCTSMDLSNVNTDALTQTTYMFFSCRSLTTLDLSGWNTENVTNMSGMFGSCKNMTTLDLSGWNTASVTDMRAMFSQNTNLTAIEGLSDFDTGNVTYMAGMFEYCSSLTTLDLSNWNTGNVTDMTNMFGNCQSLGSLDVSGFNTSNVTEMSNMFGNCQSLGSLDVSGFNTSNVTEMSNMFDGCSSLTSLDLSGWNTGNVTDMSTMFSGCSNLTTIYVGAGWGTANVTNSDYMFSSSTNLVGGMGTEYDANHINKEYARIDMGPNSDQPGYLTGVFTITLPEDVTTTAVATLTHDEVNLYAVGTTIPLSYSGEVPEGYVLTYIVNDNAITGNSFDMPAADVIVSTSLMPDIANWWHADADHDGTTEERAYIITTTTGLNLLASEVNNGNEFNNTFFKLGDDITYTHTTEWNDATSTENNYTAIGTTVNTGGNSWSYKYFSGTFDGCGYTVSGIRIYKGGSTTGDDYQGLFGETDFATIKNVTLSDARITGWQDVGGIVGYNVGTIENCHVSDNVTIHAVVNNAKSHGGIVGNVNGGTVSGCTSAATISYTSGLTRCGEYGGVAGSLNGNMQNCFVIGGTVNGTSYVGAIVGYKFGGTLNHNYYHNCIVEVDGTTYTSEIGLGAPRGDYVNEVSPVYTLTLGSDISATATVTVNYNNTDYYTAGTEVTLSYNGEVPEGTRFEYFTVNGEPVEGNTFTMPFGNTEVGVVFLAPYSFIDGVLSLNYGEFNKDNKWGSDVNVSAVTSMTATDEVSFTGDCSSLFASFSNCTNMDLNNVNTEGVTNMAYMFSNCSNLDTLDLSGWNIANVTILNGMFNHCTNLKTLNLTGWDVSHVTDMPVMFMDCLSLTTIEGIKQWNTSNVTSMNTMFRCCKSLKSLDLSDWNTESLTNMNVMFMECDSLQTLNLSGWDVSHITNMNSLFWGCKGLETLDVSGWDVSNVTNMGSMFYNCSSLMTIHRSEWNTENVTDIQAMFYRCSSLETLDLSDWNTENVTNINSMFTYCSNLTTIYVGEDWSTENVTTSGGMFFDCTSLVGGMGTTYDAGHTDGDYARIDYGPNNPGYLSRVHYTYDSETGTLALLYGLFNKDNKWGNDVPVAEVTSVTATDEVSFTGDCSSLFGSFSNCTSMDLSNVNTEGCTSMNCMFISCVSLESLDVSNWNTGNVTDMNNMFTGCGSLESLEIANWNTSSVTNMSGMFTYCSSLETLEISNWNTGNVTNMNYMFNGCGSLETLDLSGWNTASVTSISAMFTGCLSLTTIYVGEGWSTENVTSSGGMFAVCTSLVGGMGTTYDPDHVNGDYAHIDGGIWEPGYFTARFDPVEYIDADGNTQTCTDYIVLEGSDDYASYGHDNVVAWYVVNHDVTYNATVVFRGGVNLILMDGATLNLVNESEELKTVEFRENLTVYVQSGGTGGIVSNNVILYSPEAIIHGGHFTLSNNYGNYALLMGDLTINGGIISAETNEEAIIADLLTINGGTVSATVTEDGNAIYAYDAVVINGGVVTTTNLQDGVGIYGYNNVTINGGIVTVNTTDYFVGIQTGYNGIITLGWTNESDRITASSYYGDVTVATGQAFSDETGHCYMNTLTDDQIEAIAGQTLSPFNDFGATFTITYVTNGGTLPEAYPATYTFAETVTLPIPTKEDNTFAGWYDDATFEGDPVTEIEAGTALGNKTFYARWQPEYLDVAYLDADGQTQTVRAKVLYGKETGEYEYEGGVYTVLEGFSVYDFLHFTGDVTLILPDEGVLIAALMGKESTDEETGLYVDGNLTIFGQEKGTGILYAGLIHAGGNVNIYGGMIYTILDITSNNGNGTITLSWTALSNYLIINEYNGTVVLSKAFKAYNNEETIIIPAGQVSDNNTINAKYLTPYAETMDVSYIDEYGATHTVNAHVLYGGETILDGGYYTVIGGVYFNHTLSFEGNTTLIIPDDSNLYFEINSDDKGGIYPVGGNGITVNGNLAIYGQAGRQGYIDINATDADIYATGDVTVSNLSYDDSYYSTYGILSGGDILIVGGDFESYRPLNANVGNGTITLGYLTENDQIECSGYEGTVVVRDGQKLYYYDDEYNPVIISGTLTTEEVAAIAGEYLRPYIEPTVTQTIELEEGWNWVSFYVEGDPFEMLTQLETCLGDKGLIIQGLTAMTEYDDSDPEEPWFGTLDDIGLFNDQMYLIKTSAACTVQITGAPADPATHEITINPGWNWIGFPSAEAIDVLIAMSDFEAENEDKIQAMTGMTEYDDSDPEEPWFGTLETFVPGMGLLYFSNSDEVKTLVFQTGSKAGRFGPKK